MQWNDDSSTDNSSPLSSGNSHMKRKCLSTFDSGIGKEYVPKFENDMSFYDGEDINSRDSAVFEGDDILEVTPKKLAWFENEESITISDADININTALPSEFETLVSCSVVKDSPCSSQSVVLNSGDKSNRVPFRELEDEFEYRSIKRSKSVICEQEPSPRLKRTFSLDDENIENALHRSSTEPNLIGDFTKPCCLPLTSGRHQDLKCISASTAALLVQGGFDHALQSFKVIDCRFPYEFAGGHIKGAINLYTEQHIAEMLHECDYMGNVLVFHCEFSSERGPGLCRLLRKLDRNQNVYPQLKFPEVYVLEGGYKSFFQKHPELCFPNSYLPMLHPEHTDELRYYRSKVKTTDARSRGSGKKHNKRLGFFK